MNTGSPSIEGLPPVYQQSSLNATQTAIGGIPLTVVGSNSLEGVMPMAHGEGLSTAGDGSLNTSMMLPRTVRLPGGETVALVTPVMMDPGCTPSLGYPTMVPLNLDHTSASAVLGTAGIKEGYVWRAAGVSAAPVESTVPLSRTPSIKDSEEHGETKQTRIARFQVTKVVEEAARRGKHMIM